MKFFRYETIETHTLTFLLHNILAAAGVLRQLYEGRNVWKVRSLLDYNTKTWLILVSSRNFIFQWIYFFVCIFTALMKNCFTFLLNFLFIIKNFSLKVKEPTEESQWPRKRKLKMPIFSCQKHVLLWPKNYYIKAMGNFIL